MNIMKSKQYIFQLSLSVAFVFALLESASAREQNDCQKRVYGNIIRFREKITYTQAKKYTHLVYSFVFLLKNGSLSFEYPKDKYMNMRLKVLYKNFISLRRMNPNIKTLLGVMKLSDNLPFYESISTEQKRDNYISKVIKFIEMNDFDGYEFGYEMNETGKKSETSPEHDSYMMLLVKKMRKTFDDYNIKNKKRKKLFISTIPTSYPLGTEMEDDSSRSEMLQNIDFININILVNFSERPFKPNINMSHVDSIINHYYCEVKDLKKINLDFQFFNYKSYRDNILTNARDFVTDIFKSKPKNKVVINSNSNGVETFTEKEYRKERSSEYGVIKLLQEKINYISEKDLGGIIDSPVHFYDDYKITIDLLNPSEMCSSKKIQDTFNCPKKELGE